MTTIDRVMEAVIDLGAGRPPPTHDQVLFYDAGKITDAQHIARGGYGLDSLDRVELVMMIEDSFGFEVTDAEMAGEDLSTVSKIAAFIDRKKGES